MRDESLLKLSVITSLIGIIMLVFAIQLIHDKTVKISDITKSMTGERIVVYGSVASVYEKKGNMFLTLEDKTAKIKVVAFNKHYNIKKSEHIRVKGKVNIYKNTLEIIADDVSILRAKD